MMAAIVGVIAGLAQAAAPAHAPAAWLVTCEMGTPEDPVAHRLFRIAPRRFEEWKPAMRTWGPNLCASFPCATDKGRLEGQISSSSLILTVTVDASRRMATWRTQGASGTIRPQGVCAVKPEPLHK